MPNMAVQGRCSFRLQSKPSPIKTKPKTTVAADRTPPQKKQTPFEHTLLGRLTSVIMPKTE